MNDFQVNFSSLTPTVASYLNPDDVPGLQTLCLLGEPASEKVICKWADSVCLFNLYGPSEVGNWSTARVGVQATDKMGNVGQGIGANIWIVDVNDHTILAPVGTVGEIVIQTYTMARGYLDDDVKTASAFIYDPPWLPIGSGPRRVYKSGDLDRYSVTGEIQIAGRKDTQVKLRGQRIELDEVQLHLRQSLGDLTDVAVDIITPQQGQSTATLIALLRIEESGLENVSDEVEIAAPTDETRKILQYLLSGLDEKLTLRLPSYMIPTVYIPLRRMPLTTSGKLDRQKLKLIGYNLTIQDIISFSPTLNAGHQPSTEMELVLQRLWSEALETDQAMITRESNFFRLGGDSMASMQLVSAARKLGYHLTVNKIFMDPTLAKMAAAIVPAYDTQVDIAPFSLVTKSKIEAETLKTIVGELCNITEDVITDIYPCSSLQEEYMENSVRKPGCCTLQTAWLLPADLDLDRFKLAWENVVATYALSRTRIVKVSSQYLQVVCEEPVVWNTARTLPEYLVTDTTTPIADGALLNRCAIVGEDDLGQRYFVWTSNHAITDAWTIQLIMDELENTYRRGKATFKEAKFNQFIQFIMDLDKDAAAYYWREQLAGVQTKPLYPKDRKAEANTLLEYEIRIDKRTTSDATFATVVQAAWAYVVSLHTGSADIVLGTVLSDRNAPVVGIERMVGPIITTVPVRINLDADQKTTNLLAGIQSRLRSMAKYEHTGMATIRNLSDDVRRALSCTVPILVHSSNHHKAQLGSGIGLKRWTRTPLSECPFGFSLDCSIAEHGLDVASLFDNRVIETSLVQQLLVQFTEALQQMTTAGPDHQLKDMVLSDRSITDANTVIRRHEMRTGTSFDADAKTTSPFT